ncbi:hypothetical protein ACWDCL_01780 [Streptomyces sp. NPDC001009]
MDWNSLTLFLLALFSLLTLFVGLLVQFFKQLPELFQAIRDAWASFKGQSPEDRDGPPSA